MNGVPVRWVKYLPTAVNVYYQKFKMAAEESKSGTSETATKAASESAFPNDSPAQAGASMGVSLFFTIRGM